MKSHLDFIKNLCYIFHFLIKYHEGVFYYSFVFKPYNEMTKMST